MAICFNTGRRPWERIQAVEHTELMSVEEGNDQSKA